MDCVNGVYKKKINLSILRQYWSNYLIDFVLLWQVKYTEEYEQSKGKGSFPAMITPGYQAAKKASTLASNVSGYNFCLVPF